MNINNTHTHTIKRGEKNHKTHCEKNCVRHSQYASAALLLLLFHAYNHFLNLSLSKRTWDNADDDDDNFMNICWGEIYIQFVCFNSLEIVAHAVVNLNVVFVDLNERSWWRLTVMEEFSQ